MDTPSIDPVTFGQHAKGGHRPEGLSLLEMMLVVNLILIVACIATTIEAFSSQPSAFSEHAEMVSSQSPAFPSADGLKADS